MNKLANAIREQDNFSTTANGAVSLKSSFDKNLDFFSIVGSCRNQVMDAIRAFDAAYQENSKTAIRILLWARDARGGAGERKIFRIIVAHMLEKEQWGKVAAVSIMLSGVVEEIGRYDDYVEFLANEKVPVEVRRQIAKRLMNGITNDPSISGLIAKWLPRKGKEAAIIRNLMDLNPKMYRKMLVAATNVVETKMCAQEWSKIEFSHVPSVAMSRYTKAFARNSQEQFTAYKEALKAGTVKAKASVLFPYDVTRTAQFGDKEVADAQWKELPDYLNGASKILPMIDVSGSMCCAVGNNSSLNCMDIAISLGIYIAERQEGAFKNMAMTFETEPSWIIINQPTIKEKVDYVKGALWGGSTNIENAFNLLLTTATIHNVSNDEMPEYIIIISDMEFDRATGSFSIRSRKANDMETMYQTIDAKFEAAGYTRPKIIFWNVNARSQNVQVAADTGGTAMISGFSPAIMKSILACEEISPTKVMLEAISSSRYDIVNVTV